MRIATVCLLLLLMAPAVATGAQDDCAFPAKPNPETGACELNGGIHIDIHAPAWLLDYPNAQATVDAFLASARQDYLIGMAEEPYRYLGRTLVLEIDYDTVWHNDKVVTLLFTQYVDYGWLYPTDSLHSFTFDLKNDRQLSIRDLLRDDVTPEAVLAPILRERFTADDLDLLYLTNRLDTPTIYTTFTLESDTLTLIYPTIRSGPLHAGAMSLTIPLEDLSGVLNPDLFGS